MKSCHYAGHLLLMFWLTISFPDSFVVGLKGSLSEFVNRAGEYFGFPVPSPNYNRALVYAPFLSA